MGPEEPTDHGAFWGARVEAEARRDEDDPRKRVHTDLLWREIDRAVGAGRRRILDAGAGTGRFSIPLARRGHRVVHLDVSPAMLEFARCAAAGVEGIDLVEGAVEDLSRFPDGAFDVTLCLDSPLSFCPPDRHEAALDGLTRVTRSALVVCVMNRTGACLEDAGSFDLRHFARLETLPVVYDTGTLRVTPELRSLQPTLVPSWHAFRPAELRALLEARGWRVESITAPGTLARFGDPDLLRSLFDRPPVYAEYLDLAEKFDRDPDLLGVGAARAGGLLARAVRASV
jgi:SAM-dependent methyltransferase